MPECDYCFKIILIGDSGVGKTSLLNRFADDFYVVEFVPTIGVDFKIRTIPVDDKKLRIQFWDTAGQEKFRSISTCYFRSSDGVIVIYDVCNPQSFNNVASWMKLVDDYCSNNVVKMVIGNKTDSGDGRKISREQGQQLASHYGAQFKETSAQDDINVRQTFFEMARLLKEHTEHQKSATNGRRSNSIIFTNHEERKNPCCSLM